MDKELTPLLSHNESIVQLLASREEILRMVEQSFPVKIFARGDSLEIRGDDKELTTRIEDLLTQFAELTLNGQKLSSAEIRYGLHQIGKGERINLRSLYDDVICVSNKGKPIRPYTNGQKEYISAIRFERYLFVAYSLAILAHPPRTF